ncbi:hypothetical protein COO91_09792 (plasmid) [Nostoc flagelliforme CCNUN1]|uniref:Uncharacterized protein n=1 Tax=Nostoc flagelliforme CCNUN1 TaxID=2038116 RepID=A0A2K8T7G3_9NOSO|nr:hypothetical protein COO91_09792 [Nostoc flagelliforme CCNUN1]
MDDQKFDHREEELKYAALRAITPNTVRISIFHFPYDLGKG